MVYRGKKKYNLPKWLPIAAIVVVVIVVTVAAFYGTGMAESMKKPPDPTPTPTVTVPPTETPEPVAEYDFSQPVPQSEAAPEDYFEDAVFVGDSRTDGFLLYSGVQGAKGIVHTGLTIFGVMDSKVIGSGSNKKTVIAALKEQQYGKVYISLGVNELGYQNDTKFYEAYCRVIDAVREAQPNAVIYIQGLIPLNESQVNQDYLRNDHLQAYNALMAQVAEEKQVAYLDLYSHFVDENGQLPADASNDGVHLKKTYCQDWLAYLQVHTVTEEQMGLKEETT